jgi:cation diffusion facilitator family transporter
MPDPTSIRFSRQVRRVAVVALIAGAAITGLKFVAYLTTDSVAVLSDALESIVNMAAAAFMVYALWFSNRPADRGHPYGHGKVEFFAVAFEGLFVLAAGVLIAVVAVSRLISGGQPRQLTTGMVMLGVIALLSAALGFYVLRAGRRYENQVLVADAHHLLTDVLTTAGVWLGLLLTHLSGEPWLDPVVAIVVAVFILRTSVRLLRQAVDGLMDRTDPSDEVLIRRILDEELASGAIRGYHKVRHRHTGEFHWVDLHLQVDADMTVAEGHDVASRIELRIEEALPPGNATAHIEPWSEGPAGALISET